MHAPPPLPTTQIFLSRQPQCFKPQERLRQRPQGIGRICLENFHAPCVGTDLLAERTPNCNRRRQIDLENVETNACMLENKSHALGHIHYRYSRTVLPSPFSPPRLLRTGLPYGTRSKDKWGKSNTRIEVNFVHVALQTLPRTRGSLHVHIALRQELLMVFQREGHSNFRNQGLVMGQ